MSVFLYLIMITSAGAPDQIRRFEFKDMAECNKQLTAIKIDNKRDTSIVALCANDKNHRSYNATWWDDPVKRSDK